MNLEVVRVLLAGEWLRKTASGQEGLPSPVAALFLCFRNSIRPSEFRRQGGGLSQAGFPMSMRDHYRTRAAEFQARARIEYDENTRHEYDSLARHYLRLAEQAERKDKRTSVEGSDINRNVLNLSSAIRQYVLNFRAKQKD
jgi:hypothetical protein